MKQKNQLRILGIALLVFISYTGLFSCSKNAEEKVEEGSAVVNTGRSDGLGGTVGAAVDLGLSVRWADHNIGAKSAEELGGLYGWADPTGAKKSQVYSDYPNDKPSKTISGTEYDIATVNWGKGWRLPSAAEFQELLDNTTREWTSVNGVNGYKFTGKKAGYTDNSIFIPAAGYRDGNMEMRQNHGDYWSGTLCDSSYYYANYFYFGTNYSNVGSERRYYGQSVRAVYK